MKITVEKGFNELKQKDLYIIKFDGKVSGKDFQTLKKNGIYYSKFLKNFMSYKEFTSDQILQFLSEPEAKTKETKKNEKVEYKKNLFDYITVEDYKQFLLDHYSVFENLPRYNRFRHATIEEDIKATQKEYIEYFEESLKRGYSFDLGYIRQAIIHKSLGLPIDEFRANGDSLRYLSIWDRLPIIEDLKIDYSKSYTASWGYDQTNIDIAYELNKRVWGLDVVIVTTNFNNIMFVRIKKDERVYFAFSDGVRNFRKDPTPLKTFEQDASQTGHYR